MQPTKHDVEPARPLTDEENEATRKMCERMKADIDARFKFPRRRFVRMAF